MFQSKRLKEPKESGKLYLWWIESDFSKPYYKITDSVRRFFNYISKLYGWHKHVFKNDHDFDAHSLFAIIEYKLKRVQKVIIPGHSYQEPKDLQALRIAIKLSGRLKDDKYSEAFYNRHDRKWGKMKSWFTPIQDSTNSYWHHSRAKVVFQKDKELEKKDFSEMLDAQYKQIKRDERWLYDILHKYLRNLWD